MDRFRVFRVGAAQFDLGVRVRRIDSEALLELGQGRVVVDVTRLAV